jgi:hypothetical protein
MIKGYLLITADTPLIGIDPHPAHAPDPAPEAFGATVWARLYHVGQDRQAMERKAQGDLQARRDAGEDGGPEDSHEEPDDVLPVTVSDAGVLTIMDPNSRFERGVLTPGQVYGAFGMSCPIVLPDQRAEAWALIRDQLDGLAGLLRAAGVDRVEAEFLQEDGIAGLQDVLLFGPDDIPLEADDREFPLPPLVSSNDFGRTKPVPLDGTGDLTEVTDAVFTSLSELVLNDPDAVVDRIEIRLDASGTLSVRTEAIATQVWTPPEGVGTRPDEDGPGL